jgi:thioester reductase-like protein
MVPHRAVNRLVINNGYLRVDTTDCIAHCSSPEFDASTFEIWGALLNGATLLIVPPPIVLDAESFATILSQRRVTILWLTVGLLAQYSQALAGVFSRLRCLITGGDVVDPGIVRAVLRNGAPQQFLNGYGPTECTTFSAVYPITAVDADATSLPIGRPISNTRVYILDERLRPLPIGGVGEIYIGGDGVARGYLNRPDLTAERFLADGLSGEPQARIYKSGDLGRWRSDGTIEFLGRNDQQVKLRGFRIELGEIEAQLLRLRRVREAVVVAREDVPGDRRLVAYVIASEARTGEPPSVVELRDQLKGVLPEYMVPSAIVLIDALPLTPNGKLDRRALPAPALNSYISREYEPPQGEVAIVLARQWQDLLRVERVGRHDSFFELGGHSLLALKAVARINESFKILLKLSDIYRSKTVQELSSLISGGTTHDHLINLAQEAVLDSSIAAKSDYRKTFRNAVLLTGSTGFVGRFLLAQLLRDTTATVYCLVRAQSESQAASRLEETLSKWDLVRAKDKHRIVPIHGDLGRPRLGIDEATYQTLSRKVSQIFHCATSMNHLETYAMARPVNVQAQQELLRLAAERGPKLFNYISTMGVFRSSADGRPRIVDEQSSIEGEKHRNSDGYLASKWVGERLCLIARERGLRCNIFRLGLVWADTQRGRYDELQHMHRLLKTCLLAGKAIKNYRYESAPIPVDHVARAIVHLAKEHPAGQRVFHIAATGALENLFERCNEVAHTSLELLPLQEWISAMRHLQAVEGSLPVMPLMELYERQTNTGLASVEFNCARTVAELELAGIIPPVSEDELLRAAVDGIVASDPDLLQHSAGSVLGTLDSVTRHYTSL